jgi:hypothetical protein
VREGAETRRSQPPENADSAVTRSISLPLVLIAFALVTLFLSAGVLVTYFAYDKQSSKVDDLERTNEKIQMEHVAIGGLIKKQQKLFTSEIEQARARASRSFARGFSAARQAETLPAQLRPLARYAAVGLRVPRLLPAELRRGARIGRREDGYTLRWRAVSVFASSTDPLSVWTRQGWPGFRKRVKVGRRSVFRVLGPYGVMFAWRERGDTYAVLSYPQKESLARLLVTTMA